MSDARLGFTPSRIPESKRRSQMREDGYRHGREGAEKQSTEPEYLTSYRRGREAKERET